MVMEEMEIVSTFLYLYSTDGVTTPFGFIPVSPFLCLSCVISVGQNNIFWIVYMDALVCINSDRFEELIREK